jgi:hypothetical protein
MNNHTIDDLIELLEARGQTQAIEDLRERYGGEQR